MDRSAGQISRRLGINAVKRVTLQTWPTSLPENSQDLRQSLGKVRWACLLCGDDPGCSGSDWQRCWLVSSVCNVNQQTLTVLMSVHCTLYAVLLTVWLGTVCFLFGVSSELELHRILIDANK